MDVEPRPSDATSIETPNHSLVLQKGRTVISGWVMPFNASLVFGTTLTGVFDFISPRVALLPIAATVALTVLVGTTLLRKFLAPQLPDSSAFKRLLAPRAPLHRCPILVAGGVLSALMVTGAVWSSANAAEGGIIASKFDAVKNAQMQLGVMTIIQKEQRVQTAVLEDIREGRASNPRRELANQGILWTHEAFRLALETRDSTVVSLFLAGGMNWRPYDGLIALRSKQHLLSDQLIQRADLLDPEAMRQSKFRRSDGCVDFIQTFNIPSDETKDLADPKKIRAYVLRSQDKQWLKLICNGVDDKAGAQRWLEEQIDEYETPTPGQCRERLLASDGKILFERIAAGFMMKLPMQRALSDGEVLRSVTTTQPGSGGGKKLTPKIIEAINEYCSVISRTQPNTYNGWTVKSMQQIVAAIN